MKVLRENRPEMRKRGILIFVMLFLLALAFPLAFPDAKAQTGCCTNPYRNTCEEIGASVCCPDSDPNIPFYNKVTCLNDNFKQGVTCTDASLEGKCQLGCCYNNGQCSNFVSKISCTQSDGTFLTGNCDQQSICEAGCCVMDLQGVCIAEDNQVRGACQNNLVIPGATYKNFYKIGEYSNCKQFCGVIVYEGNLTGYVRDSASNLAVSGSLVDANGKFATTTATGYYYIRGISSANVTVLYSKDGYSTKLVKIEILTGKTASSNVTLEPAQTASIAGIVRDNTGLPVAGATVTAGTFTETTKPDGSYLIQNVQLGSYNVVASKLGYLKETKQLSIQKAERQTLDFTLIPANTGIIKGKTTNKFDGAPMEGVKISLLQNNIEIYSDYSSATGDYEIKNVIAGSYTVAVSNSGFQQQTALREIVQQQTLTADFQLIKTYGPCNNNGICEANEYCEDGISEGCPDLVCAASYSCIDAKCVARFNYSVEIDPKQCDANTRNGLCTQPPCFCNEQPLCVNSCSPLGSCDFTKNQYCNATTFRFQTFDFNIPSQKISYCSVCSADTVDCANFCPPAPQNCNYQEHKWCDDKTGQQNWKTMSELGKSDYCSYCPGDSLCQPTNACTNIPGQKCCAACIGDVVGQNYFPTYNYPNGCPENQQKCCSECQTIVSCPSTNQCASADQCKGSIIPNAVTSPNTPICCSSQCVVSQCALNVQVNQNSGGSCKCGNTVYQVQTTVGYCCSAGYQSTPCVPLAELTGQITFGKTTGLKNIKIEILGTTYSTTTDSYGKYVIKNIPIGTYNIRASDANNQYSTYTQANFIINTGTNRLDFSLTPIIGNCDKGSPPSSGFKAINIRGSKDALLTWGNPCPLQITKFSIKRTEPTAFSAGTIFLTKDSFAYTDKTTEWNQEYNYTLTTYYNDGRTVADSAKIITGNKICEGKINDSIEFCASNAENKKVLRAGCTAENQERILMNCTDVYKDSVCNTYLDSSYCTKKIRCEELGLPGLSPFGLFDNKDKCLFDSVNQIQNYCYYDSTKTTVDSCQSCREGMSCYDYRNEEACLKNTCGASNGVKCQWFNTTYSALGKGICYTPKYKGSDKCGLCSSSGNLFLNTFCTQDVCSKLGNCISRNSDSCESCTDNSVCEDFDSEASCTGAQNFDITRTAGCNITAPFKYSKDACGLERCRWTGAKCIKDGNADASEDCQGLVVPSLCKRDNKDPETLVKVPEVVNTYQNRLSLEISDAGSDGGEIQTYYCLTNQESCCPEAKLLSKDLILVSQLLQMPVYQLSQGLNKIAYYSVDKNKNIEEVKTTNFFIDTAPPQIKIIYQVVDEPEDKAGINLNVTLNEFADSCYDELYPPVSQNPEEYFAYEILRSINKENGTSFEPKYSKFRDFTYDYFVNCTDSYGNFNSPSSNNGHVTIEIDRVRGITSVSPKNKTFATSTVELKVTTEAPATCEYADITQGTYSRLSPGSEINNVNTYTTILNGVQQGSYNYIIKCDVNGVIDYARAYFTIDKTPPTTYSVDGKTLELFDFTKALNEYTIYLFCQDAGSGSDIARFPPEFGCRETLYCFSPFADCNPNKPYSKPLTNKEFENQDGHICFKSVDNGGNAEATKCFTIVSDQNPPTVGVDLKFVVTNDSAYLFTGTFDDDKNLELVKINASWYLFEDSNFYSSVLGIKDAGKKTYSAKLKLFENTAKNYSTNIIIVKVQDSAGNIQQTMSTIYLDHIPPVFISQPQIINSKNELIQNELLQDGLIQNSQTLFAEYGTNITFKALINDTNWTSFVGQSNLVQANIYCRQGCKYNKAFELKKISENNFSLTIEPKKLSAGLYEILPGNYSAQFTAFDKYRNNATYSVDFKIVDTAGPKINITILNPSYTLDSGIPVLVRGRIYNITISSSEPILLNNLTYRVFSSPSGFSPTAQTAFILSSGDKTEWRYYFYINTSLLYDNLEGNNSEFIVSGKDINSNSVLQENIIDGRYFSIDTKTPGQIIFDPEIPLYTTKKEIYITGFSARNEPNVKLDIYLNKAFNASAMSAKLSKPIDTAQVSDLENTFDIGKTSISLLQNKVMFTTGKYIDFNLRRLHNERYRIETYSYDQYTKLTVSPGLEFDVADKDDVFLYEENAPTGWFGFSTIISLGQNSIEIIPYKSGSAAWDSRANRTIIYDPESPAIVSIAPLPNSVSSDEYSNITIIIHDGISGINKDSVVLTVNKADRYCGSSPYIVPRDLACSFEGERGSGGGRWVITYLNKNPAGQVMNFPEARQNLSVYFEDMAKNSNSTSWFFEYNPNVPKTPRINIFGRNIFVAENNKIYTPVERPTFYIDFFKDRIFSIELSARFSDGISISANRESTTTFFTELGSALADSREYLLTVEGTKTVDGKQYTGQWNIPVVYDKTAPDITINTQSTTNNLSNFKISGAYTEDYPDRIEVDGDVKEKAVYKTSSNAGLFDFTINLSAPKNKEGFKEINITIFDKAGNSKQAGKTIKYDTTPPEINTDILNKNYAKVDNRVFTDIQEINITASTSDESEINMTLEASEYVYSLSKKFEKTKYASQILPLGVPTTPADKSYSLVITAKDDAGNIAQKIYSVRLDQKPPQINYILPESTQNKSQEIIVNTDEDSICYFNNQAHNIMAKYKRVEKATDGALDGSLDGATEGAYDHYFTVNDLPEGTSVFRINCTDSVNNTIIREFNLTVDIKKPVFTTVSSLGLVFSNLQEKNAYIIKGFDTSAGRVLTELEATADEEIICSYECSGNKCSFSRSLFGLQEFVKKQNQSITIQSTTAEAPDKTGIYSYKIRCFDRASNIEIKNLVLYINSTTPLVVEGTQPAGTISSTSLRIAVKTNKLSYCQYNLDGIFRNFENQGSREQFKILSGLSEREYSIPVRCRTLPYGEFNTVSAVRFTIDQTPPEKPSITSSTHQNQSEYYNKSKVSLEWSTTEKNLEYSYYLLSISSQEKQEATAKNSNVTFTELADGSYIFYIKARDSVGLVSKYASFNINIDTKAPSSATLAQIPGSTNTDITVSGKVFKTLLESEGNAKVNIFINGNLAKTATAGATGLFTSTISLKEGANLVRAEAYDAVGNGPAVSETRLVYSIKEGPYVVDVHPANNSVISQVQKISAKMRARDGAEPRLTDSTLILRSILRSQTSQITGAISNTGADEITFTPSSQLAEGRYSLSINAKDVFGNTASYTYYFTIKNDASSIQLNSPFDNSKNYYTKEPKIILSGKITGAYSKASIRIRNSEFAELQITSPEFSQEINLKEGANIISLIATSPTQVLSESGDIIVYYDARPPVLEYTSPAQNAFTNRKTETLTAFYHDNYFVDNPKIAVDNNQVDKKISPYFDIMLFELNLNNGLNLISLSASDEVLNNAEAHINITLDDALPALTITSILAEGKQNLVQENGIYKTNSRAGSSVSIEGAFSEPNIAKITANSKEATININGFNNSFNVTLETTEEATEKILLKAMDKAGNNYTATIKIMKDTSAPEQLSFSPEYTNILVPPVRIRTNEQAYCNLTYVSGQTAGTQVFASEAENTSSLIIDRPLNYDSSRDFTATDVKISCRDMLGNTQSYDEQIKVDMKKPGIIGFYTDTGYETLKEYSSEIKRYDVWGALYTYLTIVADEEVNCRYSNATQEYNEMESNFSTGFSHMQITNDIPLRDKVNYTLYISCADRAGNIAIQAKTLILEVNKFIKIPIVDSYPQGYINTLSPVVSAKTYVNADCYADTAPTSFLSFIADWLTNDLLNGYKKNESRMKKSFDNAVYKHTTLISSVSDQLTDLKEGNLYSINIRCTDPSKEFGDNKATLEFIPDVTPPLLQVAFKPDADYVENSLVTISGKTELNSTIYIYMNGEPARKRPLANIDSFSEDISMFEGTNELSVVAVDKAGNNRSVAKTITYKNIGPSIARLIPGSGIFNSLHNITAVIKDNGGGISISQSRIELKNLQTGTAVSGNMANNGRDTLSMILPELQDGDYEIIAVPYDASGRMGRTEVSYFTIDKQAPAIRVTAPLDGSMFNTSIVLYAGDIITQRDIVNASLSISNNARISISDMLPYLNSSKSYKKMQITQEGKNLYVIRAVTDIAAGETDTYRIIVDTTGPNVIEVDLT